MSASTFTGATLVATKPQRMQITMPAAEMATGNSMASLVTAAAMLHTSAVTKIERKTSKIGKMECKSHCFLEATRLERCLGMSGVIAFIITLFVPFHPQHSPGQEKTMKTPTTQNSHVSQPAADKVCLDPSTAAAAMTKAAQVLSAKEPKRSAPIPAMSPEFASAQRPTKTPNKT